jgi:hypothetical protein
VALLKKVWAKLKALFAGRKSGKKKPTDARKRLKAAVRAATKAMEAPGATTDDVRARLPGLQTEYGLSSLELVNVGGHGWKVIGRVNPELPSDTKKIPSREELAAISALAGSVAQLWHANGVAPEFKKARMTERRRIVLAPASYRRPAGGRPAPEIRVGDLVEAAAEPGMRRIAAEAGATLLVNARLFLVDAEENPVGGDLAELDFLMLGPAEIRVFSAKTSRESLELNRDRAALDLIRTIPDNRGAWQVAANVRGWQGRAMLTTTGTVVGAAVRSKDTAPMRVGTFRSTFLTRRATSKITAEPVLPKDEGAGLREGYTLRMEMQDLVDIYIREITRRLP